MKMPNYRWRKPALCYCPALFAVWCKNSVIPQYYFITPGLGLTAPGFIAKNAMSWA
jgi:hypothetical protein